jgi:hypothetical protein
MKNLEVWVVQWFGQFVWDRPWCGGGSFTGSNLTELFKSRSMVANLAKSCCARKTFLWPKCTFKIKVVERTIMLNIKVFSFLSNSDRKNYTRVHDSIFRKIYDDLSK